MGGHHAAIGYMVAQCAVGAVVHPTITGRIGSPGDGGGSVGAVQHHDVRYRWTISHGQLGQ